ncbi:unnamed protein product [Pieris macdunnoughi]|uniref:GAG-pre-integrase domain-containing protein n=1 Tax=Pieris macdunnoughi TaxID=345717 RepID=A0A821XZG9_9NEOP|nr:unnamed protein product [Pieris macdunnoughi]
MPKPQYTQKFRDCWLRDSQLKDWLEVVESTAGGILVRVSGNVWHRRFCHLNSKDLNVMRDGAVKGMSYSDKAQVSKTSCIVCCEGKQSRLPMLATGHRDLWKSDLLVE